MSRVLDRLRVAKAGVKLKDREVMERDIKAEVDAIDLRKIKFEKLIEDINTRMDDVSKTRNRFLAVFVVSLLAVFAAIRGVDLEISSFGISLSQLEKVKELILVSSVGILLFGFVSDAELRMLKLTRRHLYIRKIGAEAYKTVGRTFLRQTDGVLLVSPALSPSLSPQRMRLLVESIFVVNLIFCILLVVAAFIFVYGVVLYDTWVNPNLPPLVSRAICIAVIASILVDLVVSPLRSLKYRFVDESKWEVYSFYKPGTEELSDETLRFIDEDLLNKNSSLFNKLHKTKESRSRGKP